MDNPGAAGPAGIPAGASLYGLGMVMAALIGGMVVTVLLLWLALVGDRSRGRRRCPRCWYDMSATQGLVCPECGRGAKREARLFKSRRRKRWIAASLLPLLGGIAVYVVMFFQDPQWPRNMPTIGLIAVSPWNDSRTRLGDQLAERTYRTGEAAMPRWQCWLAARMSRARVSLGGDGKLVLYHVGTMFRMSRTDASMMSRLVQLTDDADPVVVRQAASFIEALAEQHPSEAEHGEEALTKLLSHPDRRVRYDAVNALLGLKADRPGGPAPALVLASAENSSQLNRAYACGLLGLYDPSNESRRVLLAAATSTASATDTDMWVRVRAVSSLTRHAPDDAAVRELLIATLRDPAMKDSHARLVRWVIGADRWSTDDRGELTAQRRALYSDDVRSAILAAERAGPVVPAPEPGVDGQPPNPTTPDARAVDWDWARERLRKHPCFSEAERSGVKARATGGGTPR